MYVCMFVCMHVCMYLFIDLFMYLYMERNKQGLKIMLFHGTRQCNIEMFDTTISSKGQDKSKLQNQISNRGLLI